MKKFRFLHCQAPFMLATVWATTRQLFETVPVTSGTTICLSLLLPIADFLLIQ